MKLKVYADRMSQPARAVLIFCKVIGIDFEEIRIDLLKRQQSSPEYRAINPMAEVPAIVDGQFTLFERLAWLMDQIRFAVMQFLNILLLRILKLLITGAHSWYSNVNALPNHLKRGDYNYLDPYFQLRVRYVFNTVIGPVNGLISSPQAAAEGEKLLIKSLANIEDFWLKKDAPFLLGSSQPSIADLSLVCEIMEQELLDEKDYHRIFSPHKKILQWIEDTKNATRPHFDEIHRILFRAKEKFKQRMAMRAGNGSEIKGKDELHSRM